jgi:hypothetical protein
MNVDKKQRIDIKPTNKKEQFKTFVDHIISHKLPVSGTTKIDQNRLKWCLTHLKNRDKLAPITKNRPLLICDLLRILHDRYDDDPVLQKFVLILTSLASRMAVKLEHYKRQLK